MRATAARRWIQGIAGVTLFLRLGREGQRWPRRRSMLGPPGGALRGHGLDGGELLAHLGLEGAEVVVALQVEPEVRAVAEERAEPQRHGGRDRLLLGEDIVEGLAGDA